jgi:hypothetical protein
VVAKNLPEQKRQSEKKIKFFHTEQKKNAVEIIVSLYISKSFAFFLQNKKNFQKR